RHAVEGTLQLSPRGWDGSHRHPARRRMVEPPPAEVKPAQPGRWVESSVGLCKVAPTVWCISPRCRHACRPSQRMAEGFVLHYGTAVTDITNQFCPKHSV